MDRNQDGYGVIHCLCLCHWYFIFRLVQMAIASSSGIFRLMAWSNDLPYLVFHLLLSISSSHSLVFSLSLADIYYRIRLTLVSGLPPPASTAF